MPACCRRRIVVADDKEVRALMTAAWLKQMGWKDVFVLPEAGSETGEPDPHPARHAGGRRRHRRRQDHRGRRRATVIDLSTSPHYRRGHIPGAWFAIRGRLDRALAKIRCGAMIVLTSEDGVLASLAVAEAQRVDQDTRALAQRRQRRLGRAGTPLSTEQQNGRRAR